VSSEAVRRGREGKGREGKGKEEDRESVNAMEK